MAPKRKWKTSESGSAKLYAKNAISLACLRKRLRIYAGSTEPTLVGLNAVSGMWRL